MLIMQATGGVMPPNYVARRAVTLLGSGPTGGVMGASLAAQRSGISDFVAVDMGGTSYDVCLVRGGQPEIKTDWNWRYRYYIGIPMVDVQSVGAGGGSIAHVRQGALLVGPESAGSQPGPACYGRGGIHATVTDADAVLGYLPIENFAGGRMTLDVEAAREAIQRDVADPLKLDVIDAAWGIERIVNANMANAVRKVLSTHGADPRDEPNKELVPANLSEGQVSTELYAQMCYPGQNFDMSVPVPEGASLTDAGLLDLAGRFHAQHEADRGFSFPAQQPLLRGVRLVAKGVTPKPGRLAEPGTVSDADQARTSTRPVYFGTEFVDTPVYDGSVLGPGAALRGPALVEEPFTVVVVAPGSS